MKVLISSLQVSNGSSKGHLHPALEIGLALKQRGHQVVLMPLPGKLNADDLAQVRECGIAIINLPSLPAGIPLPPEQLGKLAIKPETVHLAFESFLVSPLAYQFEDVLRAVADFKPDIVVYDLLAYAAPLAARTLGIKDIAYCAGFKLIAPDHLTTIYQQTAIKLLPKIQAFLQQINIAAEFHQLELLSTSSQMVFISDEIIGLRNRPDPAGTKLLGSLPVSTQRKLAPDAEIIDKARGAVIVCFGSILEPANYPGIMELIIKVTRQFKLNLVIASKKLGHISATDITVTEYLPLPDLMNQAALIIHHGGANIFSEAIRAGARQILIPLTTDQPVQGDLLTSIKAGITIHQDQVSEENLQSAFQQLLAPGHAIHHHIQKMRDLSQQADGAINAASLIEKTALGVQIT